MTGEMVVLDHTGDTRVEWDSEKKDEVAVARDTFERLKKKGYMGYRTTRSGDKGEVMREFDSSAERIIMALPISGG